MSLIYLILAIVAVGVVLYCIERWLPMDATIKRLLQIVVILVLVYWILKELGLWHWLTAIRV